MCFPSDYLFVTSLIPSSFWDWEKGEKLDYFHNGNPRYTRVTAMEYLNGQDCSLLLTATGEEHGLGHMAIPSVLFLTGPHHSEL